MEYGDGDGGATDSQDIFRTTNGTSVPHIDGFPARYLDFQPHQGSQGYRVDSGVDVPDSSDISQFTMVFDMLVPSNNTSNYLALWNADPNNSNDAEVFLSPDNSRYHVTLIGDLGGTWPKGRWNRFVFVNDGDVNTSRIYLNGDTDNVGMVHSNTWSVQDAGSSLPNFWILTDDNGETSGGLIANFAFVPSVLDVGTINDLGAPDAGGIFLDAIGVVGSQPIDGEALLTAPSTLTLDFSHNLDPTSIAAFELNDLTVGGQPVTSVNTLDADTLQFTLAPLGPGNHAVSLAAAAVASTEGVPSGAYSGQFAIALPPQVTTNPATNIEADMATLNGEVLANGFQDPTVRIYWGTTDRGTDAAS